MITSTNWYIQTPPNHHYLLTFVADPDCYLHRCEFEDQDPLSNDPDPRFSTD